MQEVCHLSAHCRLCVCIPDAGNCSRLRQKRTVSRKLTAGCVFRSLTLATAADSKAWAWACTQGSRSAWGPSSLLRLCSLALLYSCSTVFSSLHSSGAALKTTSTWVAHTHILKPKCGPASARWVQDWCCRLPWLLLPVAFFIFVIHLASMWVCFIQNDNRQKSYDAVPSGGGAAQGLSLQTSLSLGTNSTCWEARSDRQLCAVKQP